METKYPVQCEIGKIDITSYRIVKNKDSRYNCMEILEETNSREAFKSNCYKELLLDFAKDDSYRKTASKLDRIRWEKSNVSNPMTIANTVEAEGNKISNAMEKKAADILGENGFNEKGMYEKQNTISVNESHIEEEKVQEAIEKYNMDKQGDARISEEQSSRTYEDNTVSTNISIDDVGVKKQTENRKNREPKKGKSYIQNTISHIEQNGQSYIINSMGIVRTLLLTLAFLIGNKLHKKGNIVFFVDGARDLYAGILRVFEYMPHKIILDWYHLVEKCKIQLSLAMRNRHIRNELLEKILPFLWLGEIDKSISILNNIDEKDVKSKDAIEKLIGYFERNRDKIPCYALRKQLGLRVSSNRGEKANDNVVAERQKHNGMSFSKIGSFALASVKCIFCNNEEGNWIKTGSISFNFNQ